MWFQWLYQNENNKKGIPFYTLETCSIGKEFFFVKKNFLKQLVLLVNGLLFLPQKNALF